MIYRHSPEDRSPFPSEIEGGGVVLTLTPDQLYVTFAKTLPLELDTFLAQYRLQPVPEEYGSGPRSDLPEEYGSGPRSDLPEEYGSGPRSDLDKVVLGQRWLQSATGENTARLITEIRADDRVATATPVYHRADFLPVVTGLSFVDHLLVRFHPCAAEEEIRALIETLGTEDVVSMPDAREGPLHQLRLRDPKRQEVFEIVHGFAQSPMVRYAGPDWIQLHSPLTVTPNDPLFNTQWNLTRIGAPAGWDLATGGTRFRRIVIAIVDSGCDLNHPDLVANYVPASDHLDLISLPLSVGRHVPSDAEEGAGHGTCSAGVAAAVWNNNLGIAGVAPDCLIMPIRLFGITYLQFGPDVTDSPIYLKIVVHAAESNFVKAIDWARTHGADVINMSLYFDGSHTNADIALNNAHAAGLVLVASSGNCFVDEERCPSGVTYPATHPQVIAVGASDPDDRRHTQASPDPVFPTRPWESNYGPELSVMAPTIVPAPTKLFKNQIFALYSGTSASAPHVAGLAALLLALLLLRRPVTIQPFTQMNDLVRYIIEKTAAKVGGYNYATDAAHPNGTWHEQMGYGRIDVASALRFAYDNYRPLPLPPLRPPRRVPDYARAVQILIGLTSGGPGVVLPPGGPPVPVDPGWQHLTPQTQDVLLGLAITELAEGVNDKEARRALKRAGIEVIERAARQIEHD